MQELQTPLIYDGTGKPAPQRVPLRAGALSMMYEDGTLRYIRLGEQEILRQIYAAVRNHNWDTIPFVLRDVQIDAREDSFDITFTSDHQQDDIHFVWRGRIEGRVDSSVSFSFDGEVLTRFRRNRIGFCVLHPMTVAGLGCAIEHVDGSVEQNAFPQYIEPHQPFFEIRAMTHEVVPGVRAEVRMEGDIFESEDQRNWTDASFKTYCTPLRLPFPATVEPGTRVQQRISVRLLGDMPQVASTESSLTLTLREEQRFKLPQIGLQYAGHGESLTEREIERLKALNLAYLRLNLRSGDDYQALLAQASRDADSVGVPLELALLLGEDLAGDLEKIAAAADAVKPKIVRWLIFRYGEMGTRRETILAARMQLEQFGAPIGSGSDGFFTELNRNRPPAELLDWVAYSVNPQVHAFDNATLVETLPIQGATVESARQFTGDAKLVVGPVTLRVRWHPAATSPDPEPPPGVMPKQVDVRQMSLFGATWTLGSIKWLAQYGADAVTYFETTGWLGIMEREGGAPLPEQFPSTAGGVFPMYHVFADVGRFAGGEVLAVESSDDLRVGAVALQKDDRLRWLIANYTAEPQQVTINGLNGRFARRSIDAGIAEKAIREPEAFWTQVDSVDELHGSTVIDLLPYAIVRLDRV